MPYGLPGLLNGQERSQCCEATERQQASETAGDQVSRAVISPDQQRREHQERRAHGQLEEIPRMWVGPSATGFTPEDRRDVTFRSGVVARVKRKATSCPSATLTDCGRRSYTTRHIRLWTGTRHRLLHERNAYHRQEREARERAGSAMEGRRDARFTGGPRGGKRVPRRRLSLCHAQPGPRVHTRLRLSLG